MNKTKYLQTDSRWGGLGYPKAPWYIRNCGCGEVSICNVIIEMAQYAKYTPATIQPYCKQYAAPNGDGTYWSGIPAMMKHYGLTEVKEHATMPELFKELAKGDRVAIYLMGSRPGGSKRVHWTTSGGHFVASVDYKYKDGKHWVYMKDSYSNSSLRNGWITYEENIKGDCLKVWSGKLNGAKPSPAPTPKPAPTGKLAVDGIGGPATVMRMQQFFKVTQDGLISGQLKKMAPYFPSLKSVKYGNGGSSTIKALQKWLGLKNCDGYLGPETTKAWQKKLVALGYFPKNETIDGIFGVNSMKKWQECLNNDGKKKINPTPTPTKDKYKVIDVSVWQGNIDWKKVKADGVVGAIIRYADGDTLDSKFDKNMKEAMANGLHIGSYIFSRAKTKAQAEKEATRLFNACKKYSPDLPLYIDLEAKGLEKYADTVAQAFLNKIKALGGKGGVYANLNWWNNYLSKTAKGSFAMWLAQYNDKMTYKPASDVGMWQYSSSGSVKGISGRVDMNWLYQKYWEKKPTPTPTPTRSKQDKMCAWAKMIADSGKFKYVRWSAKNKKTQTCPICTKRVILKTSYDAEKNAYYLLGFEVVDEEANGWNCIGFSWHCWHHIGIPSRCDCGVISNEIGEQIYKAKTDAEAIKIARDHVGIKYLTVIRNGSKAIPVKDLKKGDVLLYFKGSKYIHSVLYIGDGKIAESNTTKPNISYGKKLSASYVKVAIRYTGK